MAASQIGRSLLPFTVALVLAGCAIVPASQLDLLSAPGSPRSDSLQCGRAPAALALARLAPGADVALDPDSISVVSWNIHKVIDPGWQRDLATFAQGHVLLLLQEASLHADLLSTLAGSGHAWMLASAFALNGTPTGVLTASTVPAVMACSLRHAEPLLVLPKAASITRYRLAGASELLTVANVHAVNFALTLDSYAEQLDALANELAAYPGPMILGGDLNTWNDGRRATVARVTARLGLTEVPLDPDHRRRFLGRQVDHLFLRGLQANHARAIEVRSSDHNPVSALLRLDRSAGGDPPGAPAQVRR